MHIASDALTLLFDSTDVTGPQLKALVDELQASWQPGHCLCDRRRGHRTRLPRTLELVPLDDVTERPCGEPCSVLGGTFSDSGLSFTHAAPLPYRKVRIELRDDAGQRRQFIVRLKWCRFTQSGHYESGGQIVRGQ